MNSSKTSIKAEELWERAKTFYLTMLKSQEEKNQIERYLSTITSVEIEGKKFVISTLGSYAADYLRDNYAQQFKNCLAFASGLSDLEIEFRVDEKKVLEQEENEKKIRKPSAAQPKVSNFVSTMPLKEDYTFEEFVEGPSNSFALSAARAIVKNPGKKSYYNPLFIHGGTGLGKTHLMQAIGNELKKKDPSLAICYLTAETFLNEYINSLTSGQIQSFRYKYRNVDLLLVDDVQFLHRGKENFQEEFFNTFYYLQQNEKQIIMTSDVAPKNLPSIESRLISRFEGGMVQEIESPSFETRLAILRKKAEGMEIQIPDRILEFIADKIKSHVRAMEGALVKVCMVIDANKDIIIDEEKLLYILKDQIDKESSLKRLTIEEIQANVAKKYNVTMSQILSQERTQSLVTPRQLAMYVARKYTSIGLHEIATKFEKSHATILHGVKSIEKRLDVEMDLKNTLSEVLADFGRTMSDQM